MLRSGNGQHRKPRQAPAFVVAAGVTMAGSALPLLSATGAHAASVGTWDKVAQCESGGMWSADNGNGAYGGLQMTQDTWEKYGGTAFAERPDLASRQQQIAVAEKVLSDQGAAPWGGCAVSAGLVKGGEKAKVDTGENPTASAGDSDDSGPSDTSGVSDAPIIGDGSVPSGSSNSSDSSSYPGSSSSSSASSTPSPAPSAPSASASSGAPSHSRGRHAKPTPAPSPSQSQTSSPTASQPAQPSGSPSAGDDSSAPDAPSGTPADPVPTTPGDRGGDRASRGGAQARTQDPGQDDGSYTVQPGDNLSQIAINHSVHGGWSSLYDANKSIVGSDPNLILPGQQLTLR